MFEEVRQPVFACRFIAAARANHQPAVRHFSWQILMHDAQAVAQGEDGGLVVHVGQR
jgi:hypothetical protein